MVEQIDQIDVAFQVRGFLRELQIHALQLQVLRLGHVRYKANQAKCLLLPASVKPVDLLLKLDREAIRFHVL